MKILLFGRGGQVGWELQRSLSVLGELVALDFDPAGNLLRVLQSITEGGKDVAKTDNAEYQLARGCDLTTPHATVEVVRDHLVSELGDIEGNRGAMTVDPLSWCTIEVE